MKNNFDIMIKTLQRFNDGYYKNYYNDYGTFDVVSMAYNKVLKDYIITLYNSFDGYTLYAYINDKDNSLHILNERYEEIIDYADENGWTSEDIEVIVYGRKIT